MGGHLAILQVLRANGCPWDYNTCEAAVNNLEILRWARENGCEWTEETRGIAADELGYTDELGNLLEF